MSSGEVSTHLTVELNYSFLTLEVILGIGLFG